MTWIFWSTLIGSFVATYLVFIWIYHRRNDLLPHSAITFSSVVLSVLFGASIAMLVHSSQMQLESSQQRDAYIRLIDEEINFMNALLEPNPDSTFSIVISGDTQKVVNIIVPSEVLSEALLSGLFSPDTCIDLATTISLAENYNLYIGFLAAATFSSSSVAQINAGQVVKTLNTIREQLIKNCRALRNRLSLTSFEEWKRNRGYKEGILVRPKLIGS